VDQNRKDEKCISNPLRRTHVLLETLPIVRFFVQRPQLTRRTSWKLVANPGWQPGFPTSFQLVRLEVGCGLNQSGC